jgi:His/Glu/Gln/Arg/opine family amino acid ABC transporter permease subunit
MSTFLNNVWEFLPILLQGTKLTVLVTLGSLVISTLLGLVWAAMRVSGIPLLAKISAGVINLLRGIPIIVLLFYIYFVMPDFGISLTALQAGILGLGIAYSAYQSENFRAGIEAVDHGQVEAAQAMGMSWRLTMRRVVLPQAFRIVAAALRQHHDHDAQGLVAGLDHHRGRTDAAGQADRHLHLPERHRVLAGRAALPDHVRAADPAGAPFEKRGKK